MRKRWGDRAEFVTIYIKEAHPEDEWQMDSNEEESVCYVQPKTTDQRLAIARDFTDRFEYAIPLWVDPIENPADEIYAGWPERLYVVDEEGVIRYKGKTGPFGFEPDEVEAWLEERFGPAEPDGAEGDVAEA